MKGKGKMTTYWLIGLLADHGDHHEPSAFHNELATSNGNGGTEQHASSDKLKELSTADLPTNNE